jgi:ABC-2 type transport system permease protein
VAPYMLRVRALGLEGQLYESDNYNAELALPGRFDWAFVLTYLMPLILIALLHDLKSGEREAGRMNLLLAMARERRWLWLRRVVVRAGLVYAALIVPFLAAAAWSGAAPGETAAIAAHALGYGVFWTAIIVLIGGLRWGSVTNAATLAATWLVVTLVLPATANLAINAAIPVAQGVELTLAQRETIHAGWDRPKEETMAAFFRNHPEWRDTAPLDSGFHWKWYYAFHQVGDESVAAQAGAYRDGLIARDEWTRRLGWLLPSVGIQAAVHRLAATDLRAQLAYQDRIRAFHAALRAFYYPYMFRDLPFGRQDFANAPRWPADDSDQGSSRPTG